MDSHESGPIFIGGEGRSGTTLLSLVLDSHRNLSIGPELHFRGPKNLGPYILTCLELYDHSPTIEEWVNYKKNPKYYSGVNFVIRCHRFGIEPTLLKNMVHQAMDGTNSELESFSDRCFLINTIGEHIKCAADTQRWGIKIMKDIKIAEKYHEFWPKSQFVHIIRDGRDVAASQLKEHKGWGYDDIEQAAKSWVDTIEKVKTKRLPVYEIRHEDLVFRTEHTLKKIAEYLGICWDNNMLAHETVGHSLFENPYNHPSISGVIQPVNSESVGRYKQDLTKNEIELFNRIANHLLIEYGYL